MVGLDDILHEIWAGALRLHGPWIYFLAGLGLPDAHAPTTSIARGFSIDGALFNGVLLYCSTVEFVVFDSPLRLIW